VSHDWIKRLTESGAQKRMSEAKNSLAVSASRNKHVAQLGHMMDPPPGAKQYTQGAKDKRRAAFETITSAQKAHKS
jgi:hypothetical protein